MKGVRRDPYRLEVQRLVARVPLAGARVLEVGCGDGRLSRRIVGRTGSLTGLDPDSAAIERAKALATDVRLRFNVGSAQSLEYPDANFDVVLFSSSL